MGPTCHLFVDPTLPHPIADEIRRRLRLRQSVEFQFADVHPIVHEGVQLDRFNAVTAVPADINQQDQLGRTALWRAAARGYEHQVESLIEAGADPNVSGPHGNMPLDHARKQDEAGGGYITYLLEQATSRLKQTPPTRQGD
jgi:ankyrin repeat protein